MRNKILVVAAHPDDEVLGCGGTIAKLSQEQRQVYCLILGKGKASRGQGNGAIAKEQSILREEAEESAKVLGISKLFLENFPDQQYDTVPLIEIIKAVEKVKDEIKPDAVFTHCPGDLNMDHRIVCRAVLTACRPLKGETIREIYSFETLSSTEWGGDVFRPDTFVDIRNTLQKKIKAMSCYKSEIREFPHPRSLKVIEDLAKLRGSSAGLEFAEAFKLIREIN